MGRRQLTTAITLVVLCALLVLGAVWGWRSLFAEVPTEETGTEQPAPTCTTERVNAGQRLRSSQVRVSVFNGGTRSGLADSTMAALRKRGFLSGEVGNAPSDVTVRQVAVWSTEENDPRARLVARQFGKRVPVRFSDVDLGPGIDVIVGDRFRGLVNAKKSIRVRQAQEVCVPVESATPETNAAGR